MTREEIEKKAYEVYPEIREEHTERDINAPYRKAYIKGLTEQLDCPKIKGWVARDKDGTLKLFRDEKPQFVDGIWYSDRYTIIDKGIMDDLFPEVTWEGDPIEVELIVNRI